MLEVFLNPSQTSDYEITHDCSEFSSLCPKTGQPDFANIAINYVPDRVCVETKSLKMYLFSYRNTKTFMEDAINKIAHELYENLRPKWLEVVGVYNIRGGIQSTIKVALPNDSNNLYGR